MLFPEHVQMGQNVTPPPTGSGPLTGFGPPPPAAGPPMARGEIVPYNKVEEQTLGKMNAKNQKNTVKAGHKIRDIEIKMQEAAVVQKKVAERERGAPEWQGALEELVQLMRLRAWPGSQRAASLPRRGRAPPRPCQ